MEPITDIAGCFGGFLATSISSYIGHAVRYGGVRLRSGRGTPKRLCLTRYGPDEVTIPKRHVDRVTDVLMYRLSFGWLLRWL